MKVHLRSMRVIVDGKPYLATVTAEDKYWQDELELAIELLRNGIRKETVYGPFDLRIQKLRT